MNQQKPFFLEIRASVIYSLAYLMLFSIALAWSTKTIRHVYATTVTFFVFQNGSVKYALTTQITMSTAMNFSSKSFKPRAPDKGAFPLDHFGECKDFKEKYLQCLRENRFDNSLCRVQSKDFLECRMDHQLMAREPLEKLGFKDLLIDPPPSPADQKSKA